MRRLAFLIILALPVLLLHSCSQINVVYKENPVSSAPGALAGTSTDVPEQESDAAKEQGTSPEGSAGPSYAPVAEEGTSDGDASVDPPPKKSAQETENKQPEDTYTENDSKETPDTSAAQEPEISQNDMGEQPPLLKKTAEAAGLSVDDFNFSQLLLVAADGAYADIYCYDKADDGLWKLNKELSYIKGYVGKNGVSFNKTEGDNTTPGGLFKLGYAFGNSPKPVTAMAFKPVTPESYWVDDPNSIYYNQWVEGKADVDWNSAEHLSESKKYYAYAVVVEYNMTPDTVPGKGSAIFLHCKNEPTTGCIAVPEETMLKILKWLDPDKKPSILIVNK